MMRPAIRIVGKDARLEVFLEETTKILSLSLELLMPEEIRKGMLMKVEGFRDTTDFHVARSVTILDKLTDSDVNNVEGEEFVIHGKVNFEGESEFLEVPPAADVGIWIDREVEQRNIKIIERLMKRSAADCVINRYSNFLEEEEENTPETDFQSGKYTCLGVEEDIEGNPLQPLPIDLTTYHLFYAEQEFAIIELRIRKMFRLKSSWDLESIIDYITSTPSIPPKNISSMTMKHESQTVLITLSKMVVRKEIIYDRFGFMRFLHETDGMYYLCEIGPSTNEVKERFVPEVYDKFLTTYTGTVDLMFPVDFENTSTKKSVKEVGAIRNLDVSSEDFEKLWDQQTARKKIQLLEDALIKKPFKSEEIRRNILSFTEFSWFEVKGYIFHYLNQMIYEGQPGYTLNPYELNTKNSLRVYYIGDKKGWRNSNNVEDSWMIRVINIDWNGKNGRAEQARNACPELTFIGIQNTSSDGGFRIRDRKIKRTIAGTVDKRSAKGQNTADVTSAIKIAGWLWQVDPDYDHGLISSRQFPETIDLLIEIVSKFIAGKTEKGSVVPEIMESGVFVMTVDPNVEEWTRDKLGFFYLWEIASRSMKRKAVEHIADVLNKMGCLWFK